ncbi:pyridoxamine 5'-phosphate oxidase [Myroides guanonis]|uniref:Pyridoxine/pyridoxamine 5'-phosphate oxidase n=1 Tax=Myroides guanonis TaxID=1150112 RepID=A0A1I3RD16_9FLAO|nr:pyridoxamine 5'-phosphate oxidase [Myroides guanonis]SFJ43251.1 Pyridoxamine 5'-phosphate oxidase [Myroides guanonis]
MTDLNNYRKTYERGVLLESEVEQDPMMQFKKWFYEVESFGGVEEVNAMTVSTIGLDGFPKSRVVLLKSYDEYGFVFYTNYDSEKGKAIEANPNVCISFFWPSLERQVIVKGQAYKVSEQQSINYFDSRPEGSRKGAIASPQSQVVKNYEELEKRLKDLDNIVVEKPVNWGGYCIEPISIEFWQGRPNRLHDRIRYSLIDKMDWKIERLAP